MGVAIALDDFGTGFSSLSYSSRLPIDKIKIDSRFVRELADPGVRKIVAAIINMCMCEALNIKYIAKGVETMDDFPALKRLGRSLAQGYAFARPMRLAKLRA
jgi:EAL domain-containing protein (putative c-di-GMP-specific phosphodiesterase class I)